MEIQLRTTCLEGVYELQPSSSTDNRGQFTRLYCSQAFSGAMRDRKFAQINHSVTRRIGTIRGMHFQYPPYSEAKLITCIKGKVWDVAVDLRRGSPTFLRWYGVELEAARMNAIFLTEGFAHGFQVLSPDSTLLYMHTAPYSVAHEGAVRWDDPSLAIKWPMIPTEISEKDRNLPNIDDSFKKIIV